MRGDVTDATLLDVRNLSVSFAQAAGVKAVDDVSFTVQRGRTLALVGESGSGKSLTALSILKLLPSGATVSGQVLFKGQDLMAAREPQLRAVRGDAITMVFQEPMTRLIRSIRSASRSAKFWSCMARPNAASCASRSSRCSKRPASATRRAVSPPIRISCQAASASA